MRPSGQCSYEIVSFPLKVNEKNVTLLDGTGACWDEASCWVPASGTRRPSTLQWLMWIMNCNYVFGYNSNLIYHFSIILGILTSCCFLYINNLSRNLLKCKVLIFKRNDEFYGLLWIYWHLNLELIVIRFCWMFCSDCGSFHWQFLNCVHHPDTWYLPATSVAGAVTVIEQGPLYLPLGKSICGCINFGDLLHCSTL